MTGLSFQLWGRHKNILLLLYMNSTKSLRPISPPNITQIFFTLHSCVALSVPGIPPSLRLTAALSGESCFGASRHFTQACPGPGCVDMTGSHLSVKESKSLPGQSRGIKMINYRGSNRSYNTIYIPCSSWKKGDGSPTRPLFLHIFRPPTALFPAASCLQDNSKHRELGESKQGRTTTNRGTDWERVQAENG